MQLLILDFLECRRAPEISEIIDMTGLSGELIIFTAIQLFFIFLTHGKSSNSVPNFGANLKCDVRF